jgi:hypothetical protein
MDIIEFVLVYPRTVVVVLAQYGLDLGGGTDYQQIITPGDTLVHIQQQMDFKYEQYNKMDDRRCCCR